MGDFILDFRQREHRSVAVVSQHLRWFPDTRVVTYESDHFSLTFAQGDDPRLWGPYEDREQGLVVVLSGRVAWDEPIWLNAASLPGDGGLAAKLFAHRHRSGQPPDDLLNGAFTLLVGDLNSGRVTVVTDRCGMCPVYYTETTGLVLGSHPDVLAGAAGDASRMDSLSIAEFLMTGRISYPCTYHTNIKGLETGSIYECRAGDSVHPMKRRTYFSLDYLSDPPQSERTLVEQLGAAFRQAVQRRTLPRFGKTAISLSGGLDSRTLLCCRDVKSETMTFTFFDKENFEYQISSRIAQAAGVPLKPFPRDFEHYAKAAAMGVRLQGGMGNFANNHFLGFRDQIKSLGVTNLIAGFYCDYLFKGLGLDTARSKITGLDRLISFSLKWYRPRYTWPTMLCREAEVRHRELFADISVGDNSDISRLRVEGRRLFPLAYEPDNAETVITQRAFPWYLPTVDAELIDVYRQIPPQWKLNCRLYAPMVIRECGPEVAAIPDANTGLPVGRLGVAFAVRHAAAGVKRRLRHTLRPQMGTEGSWPNWAYYVHNSPLLREIWNVAPLAEEDIVRDILGWNPFVRDIRSFDGGDVELLTRLLTLRFWFNHRVH